MHGQKTVLDIETLEILPGTAAAAVGAVDSGLDVLFALLTGETRPTAGMVRVAGVDPGTDKAQFSQRVGVMFANDNLYTRRSPLANLKFYGRLYRLPSSRAIEVIEQVGLADHANVQTETLSSSLLRRLAFGRAILHNPQILLLEEPFARCDEAAVAVLCKLIQQYTETGGTVLIFSAAVDHLHRVCENIYRLEAGRIAATYQPEEEQGLDLPFVIPARLEGRVALVDPADILYVFAQDDRTFLQTADEQLPTQFTLSDLEKRLSRSGFFRAHRGYLVNLQYVKEVIPYTRDSYTLRLKDAAGTEIPLSRAAFRELREILGY